MKKKQKYFEFNLFEYWKQVIFCVFFISLFLFFTVYKVGFNSGVDFSGGISKKTT